jgi:nucleoside-diphosphate-sugar epimerase
LAGLTQTLEIGAGRKNAGPNSKMKFFITGTTGFLGRSLKQHFEPQHEVVEYIRGASITDMLTIHQPNVIIHCAGEIYNADKMFSTNVCMVEEILEWVKRNRDCRMIQIGSSSEYGPVDYPTSEQDRINPQNAYEATKGAATLLCQGYSRQFDLQVLVARIYSGYGAHERPHRLFPKLYRAFYHNEPITLYRGVHDFIYIEDFVRGIELTLAKSWPTGEIVNFGSGRQYTNVQVLEAWERVTGRTALLEYHDRFSKSHDTKFWCCNTSYAEDQYGFVAQYTLEQGIEDMIRKLQ